MNYNIALLYEDLEENETFINSRLKSIIDILITIRSDYGSKENKITIFGNKIIDNIECLGLSEINENFSKYDIILIYGKTEKFLNDISLFLENFKYDKTIIYIPNIRMYKATFSFIKYLDIFKNIFLGTEYEYYYFLNNYLEGQTCYKNKIYLTKFANYVLTTELGDSAFSNPYTEMKNEFNKIAILGGIGKNLPDIFQICQLSFDKNLPYYFKILINKQELNLVEDISLDDYFGNPNISVIEFIDSSNLKEFENTLKDTFLTIIPFKDEFYKFNLSELYHSFQLTNRILVNPHYSLEEFYNLDKSLPFIHFKYRESSFNNEKDIIDETLNILSLYNQNNIVNIGIADLGFCKNLVSPKKIAYEWYEYINFLVYKKKNINCINSETNYNKHFNRRIYNYDHWSIIEDDIALQRI